MKSSCHISNNNYDFAELLSEMLGELNASHTGARYSGVGGALPTASLGVFYDDTYTGDGLKIKGNHRAESFHFEEKQM